MTYPFLDCEKSLCWTPNLEVQNTSGLYAIFLHDIQSLPQDWQKLLARDDQQLYIGMAKSGLKSRLNRHFCKDASSDTFRKSIGAIMRQKLELKPYLEAGKGHKKWRFDEASEDDLSQWLKNNCRLGFIKIDSKKVEGLKKDLIKIHRPPLNIKNNAKKIMKLRDERQNCQEMAGKLRVMNELS